MNNYEIGELSVYMIISLIISSTSSSLGNLPNSFFEKTSLSSKVTSNTPPDEGIIFTVSIEFLCSSNKLFAKATAFGR